MTKTKILVTAADPKILFATSRLLKEIPGYDVLESSTGQDTLDTVRRERPDLLLLDAQLRDIHGFEVCRTIKSDPALKGIFVIMVSGPQVEEEGRTNGVESLADGYITRPFKSWELLAQVESVVRIRKVEKELWAEKEFVESLIDTAKTVILVLDVEGRIQRINPYMEQLSGYTLEEVKGKDWFETFLPEEGRNDAREIFGKAVHNKRTQGNVNPIITRNDGIRYIEWYGKSLKDAEGMVMGLLAVGRDVTTRKQDEEARQRLETAIHQAAEAVVITDPKGQIQYVNPAFEEITGYTSKEVKDKNPRFLKSEMHDEVFYKGLWDTITAGDTWRGEFINKKKDGTNYTERASISPVKDSSGQITNFIAVKEDISEEKKMSKALRLDEERLTALFKLSKMRDVSEKELVGYILEEGVRLTGSTRGIFHFMGPDRHSLRFYTWNQGHLENSEDMELPPGSINKHCVEENCVLEEGPVVHNDCRNLSGKRCFMEDSATIIRHMCIPILEDGGIVGVIGVGNKEYDYNESDVRQFSLFTQGTWDILKMKKAEEELRETNEELRIANRIKTEFVGILAHDFGNPLNLIMGYADLMLLGTLGPVSPKIKEKLGIIKDAVRRLDGLRLDTLDLARMESGELELKKEEEDFCKFVASVVSGVKSLATEKSQTMSFSCNCPEPMTTSFDRARLFQAIENYISNAIRYTSEGKRIVILVENLGEELRFSVSDTGRGIAPAELENIFQPFYRTGKRVRGSTGLGLSIVKGIIKAHGGRCWAESEGEGKGSTFYFTLPKGQH